jgi:hypothetical protein
MLKLEIVVTDTGQVSVTGPIDQLMLCYGMLEIAKDNLKAHHAAKQMKAAMPTASVVGGLT